MLLDLVGVEFDLLSKSMKLLLSLLWLTPEICFALITPR